MSIVDLSVQWIEPVLGAPLLLLAAPIWFVQTLQLGVLYSMESYRDYDALL